MDSAADKTEEITNEMCYNNLDRLLDFNRKQMQIFEESLRFLKEKADKFDELEAVGEEKEPTEKSIS